MENFKLETECGGCGETIELELDAGAASVIAESFGIQSNQKIGTPDTRAKISPASNILVYKITSDDIKHFITAKAKKYVSDINIELIPRYIEKKKGSNGERKSFTSLRIAFSESAIKQSKDAGWFEKIGESEGNVRIVESIFANIVNKYKFDNKILSGWSNDYKMMEKLENHFGITEQYLNDVKYYSNPQRVESNDGASWIIFSAAADKIIHDMIEDPATSKVKGLMIVQDSYKVSKDTVEFIVHVYPDDIKSTDNSFVKSILNSENKK